MGDNRRRFLQSLAAGAVSAAAAAKASPPEPRRIPVALIQFDAVPEQPDRNLDEMARLATQAARSGARWIMFHEGTLCDYTPRLKELAEPVPQGKATRRMAALARQLRCFLSFGLSEQANGRYFISQVFAGPRGFIYRYRKTWIWREPSDQGYRNEWARYDPGTGPELFTLDGVRATCFICADGDAPRCIERAAGLRPSIVFYPNNRGSLPDFPAFGAIAKTIGAPMLVTNRTGKSWIHQCRGGCAVFGPDGAVLAKANREGKEEVLLYTLELRA